MDKYGAAFELLRSLVEGRSPEEITDEQLLIDLSFSLSNAFFKKIEADPNWIAAKKRQEAEGLQAQQAPPTPKPQPTKPKPKK